jgi:tRNA-dihydrouridine synthase
MHGILVVLVAASLTACATTSLTSSWKAPDAQPIGSLAGQKVIAVAVTKNQAMRRSAEDTLARVLNASGAQGVPSYSIIGDDAVKDEAKAKAAIEKSGAVAVVVMRPVSKEKEISSTPSTMYMGPMYGGYWGGYYGYGWGGAWGGSEIRTDTIVSVETLVYSLKQNKLVWAGQSKTTNPSRIDAFVKEVAAGAGKEMKKLGLL